MDLDALRRRLSEHVPEPMDLTARYAVLVPLVALNGAWHILYEVRAATLRTQPGEVCFPGGRLCAGEDAVSCALRETQEELAIPPDAVHLLGELDYLYTRGRFAVYPVLARVDTQAAQALVCNPTEVAKVYFVPVETLLKMTPIQYEYPLIPAVPEEFPYSGAGIPKDYPWRPGTEIGFIYPWQDKAIWGMTGRITRHVLELFVQG